MLPVPFCGPCSSNPVSVPRWCALSVTWSPTPLPGRLVVNGEVLGFLGWVCQCRPVFPSRVNNSSRRIHSCTWGLFQEQSHGVSEEWGMLLSTSRLKLFLPLAPGDSKPWLFSDTINIVLTACPYVSNRLVHPFFVPIPYLPMGWWGYSIVLKLNLISQ